MGKTRLTTTTVMILLGFTLFLPGCKAWIAPKAPAVLGGRAGYKAYAWKQYHADRRLYEQAVLRATPEGTLAATYYRNTMLWSVIGDVNASYYAFRNDFHASRATMKTLADLAKLGMSAASTVLGGSAVLSGAVTALQGSQLSLEKNFLEEKTTEAILTTMDALRQKQMAEIQRKLLIPPPAYAFEEAYNDALALFSAGSVPSALQGIASEAGRQHVEAKGEAERATRQRVDLTLPETTVVARDTKEKLNQIVTDLVKQQDLESIRKILAMRGVPVAPNAPPADLMTKVGGELRKTRSPDAIEAMVQQFKALGLWKE